MPKIEWKIERDYLGDIKVSIPRAFVSGVRPVVEWTVVGVAWVSTENNQERYGVYDIKGGGEPLMRYVAESNAIQTLIELGRKYYDEEWG